MARVYRLSRFGVAFVALFSGGGLVAMTTGMYILLPAPIFQSIQQLRTGAWLILLGAVAVIIAGTVAALPHIRVLAVTLKPSTEFGQSSE